MALARAAVRAGTHTVVATPHRSRRWPTTPEEVLAGVARMLDLYERDGIDLRLLPGAEVTVDEAARMDKDSLDAFRLGGGPYLLIESPYEFAGMELERTVARSAGARLRRRARPPGALPGVPGPAQAAAHARRPRRALLDHRGRAGRALRPGAALVRARARARRARPLGRLGRPRRRASAARACARACGPRPSSCPRSPASSRGWPRTCRRPSSPARSCPRGPQRRTVTARLAEAVTARCQVASDTRGLEKGHSRQRRGRIEHRLEPEMGRVPLA